jgi:hypothetical protein
VAKKQLGKYDIIERLGRGGMAEVYRAYQPSLDRFVAIKLLHPFLADDPEFKDRFEREARNVARLRHPNIVQVYDFEYDAESESYYMVMELIEGHTLKDRLNGLNGQPLPTEEILRITREAAEALAYAHARGMIHRDVKPANLMLDSDGRVVLTDFGIAKIVTGHQFTASGGMVGTPSYMAPEQGLGEAGDERSDLYSLGVILFQLITGRLPYDAETPLATILKHVNEPIPSPRQFNPETPAAIERIILKALAKDPEDRFQSADEMLAQLKAVTGAALTEVASAQPLPAGSEPGDTLRIAHLAGAPAESGGHSARRLSLAGLGTMVVVGLVALFGGVTLATGRVPLLGIVLRPSETPTAVASPALTTTQATTGTVVVALPSSTTTPTNTPTYTATSTPTFTPTATATATSTPTATPTATLTLTPSDTPTPTPNITATIDAATVAAQNLTATSVKQTLDAFFITQSAGTTRTPDYTATALLCVKDYRQIVEKAPDKDPIRANTEFEREIVLRNTSNCDWLPGMYLSYTSGERFDASRKIVMKNTDPVKPGEDAVFVFRGRTPRKGGLYSGQWEVRLAGDVLIETPLTISFFAYE